MRIPTLTAIAGFIVLFFFYHAAEYMILFKNSPLGFLVFQALFFLAAYLVARWQRMPGLAAWGLDLKKHLATHLLFGMVMGILLYGTTFGLSLLLGAEKIIEVPKLQTVVAPLGLFIFGNLFSSFSEDVLTRGYVYRHLDGKVSSGLIIFISATVYLGNHIYRLDDGLVTHLYLFGLGVLYVIPLVITKRLWFTGGMHWAGNVTFYFTHEMIKTEDGSKAVSPNIVFIGVILLFIPLAFALIAKNRKWLGLQKAEK